MPRRKKVASENQNAIDLTPMLDVVFIMLIFFIVTASFIKEPGVDVDRPNASSATIKENAKILVAVTANEGIWIDRQRIDVRVLKNRIERLHLENPNGSLVIQADNDANMDMITKVTQTANEIGIEDVSVSTVNP